MNATTAGTLAQHAYELAIDPRATPQARHAAAEAATAAYAATLAPDALARLAAEQARMTLAGHTHSRHFTKAWR